MVLNTNTVRTNTGRGIIPSVRSTHQNLITLAGRERAPAIGRQGQSLRMAEARRQSIPHQLNGIPEEQIRPWDNPQGFHRRMDGIPNDRRRSIMVTATVLRL